MLNFYHNKNLVEKKIQTDCNSECVSTYIYNYLYVTLKKINYIYIYIKSFLYVTRNIIESII